MATKDLRDKVLGMGTILGALAIVMFATLVRPVTEPQQGKTLQNLQAAYNAETNAYAGYMAFADRAQEEEYYEVASLFRAAAYAEHVHVKNLAAVIREMGAEPVSRIEQPVVGTTEQNLRTAAEQNEASERNMTYPTFIEEAKVEGNQEVVRVFEYVQMAQNQHSILFGEALGNLKNTGAESHAYYVCSTCGFTAEHPIKPCPGCSDANPTYVHIF